MARDFVWTYVADHSGSGAQAEPSAVEATCFPEAQHVQQHESTVELVKFKRVCRVDNGAARHHGIAQRKKPLTQSQG